MDIALLKNQKITVIGAARSGIAVAQLLKSHGSRIFVSDSGPAEQLASQTASLSSMGIEFEVGGHTNKVYDCELMVLSPGVPSNAPVVLEAQKRKMKVVSELEVGSWFCRAPIIAITGSNGKTTTTTLIGKILADGKKKHVVAGNIGTAFSAVVSDLSSSDIAVLEVSSFQLDHIQTFRPKISIMLNITPDHMDRYEHSMEHYSASKARVFKNQRNDDVLIYCTDDPWTAKMASKAKCRRIGFSIQHKLNEGAFVENDKLVTCISGFKTKIIETDKIFIRGKHNLYNAMAATLAGQLLGRNSASIRSTLMSFEGVEHRLEFVRELNQVRFYNDSKATNVDSVWYALQAFKRPIVLLLGGRDKGNDYSKLQKLVHDRVKTIIAIGESAEKIEKAFRGATVVKRAASMAEAIAAARFLAQPGDIVMLSPACASFDWFKNYEHRGQVFKELVNKI